MPIHQLFCIDGVDLDRRVVTAEEVGRLNAQTGPMRHLDYLVWSDDAWTRAVGVKQVGDDEFWVPHHIPGRPLLPGVLMIEAAAQLASIIYRKKIGEDRFLGFTRCDDAAFRGPVVPGDTLLLLVQEVKFSPRRMVADTQGVVDDRIVFEARITGMVV